MKKILLFFITVVCLVQTHMLACSFSPVFFCENINKFHPNYHVLAGQIIDTIPNGVRFKVIETLRGVESRDTVIIWDDKPFICNGPWYRIAKYLGSIGDTLVLAIPKIDSIVNNWERTGDYRVPEVFAYITALKLVGGNLEGYIAGTIGTVRRSVIQFDYEQFKRIGIQQRDCPTVLSTNTYDYALERYLQVYPNPFTNQLIVSSPPFEFLHYSLVDVNGQVLQNGVVFQHETIQTKGIPKGIYLLVIRNEAGVIVSRKKLLKLKME